MSVRDSQNNFKKGIHVHEKFVISNKYHTYPLYTNTALSYKLKSPKTSPENSCGTADVVSFPMANSHLF